MLTGETGTSSRADGAIAACATVHGLANLLLDDQIASVRGDPAAAEWLIARMFGDKP